MLHRVDRARAPQNWHHPRDHHGEQCRLGSGIADERVGLDDDFFERGRERERGCDGWRAGRRAATRDGAKAVALLEETCRMSSTSLSLLNCRFLLLPRLTLSRATVQRKCWWDATDVVLHPGTTKEHSLKVWARRVWTLELSLI